MILSLDFFGEVLSIGRTRMNHFLLSLSIHAMYERGGIRVLKGVVQLRMRHILLRVAREIGPTSL
jgi:hypothetical protein